MQGSKRWFTFKEVLVFKNSALSFLLFQSALRITVPAFWKYVFISNFHRQNTYTCNQGEGWGLLAGVNQFVV